MKKIKMFIFVLITAVFSGIAQEDTQKHIVTSGETITQIAQKYRVTPNDIYKLNPNAINGIAADEVLLIPKSQVSQPVFTERVPTQAAKESKNTTHNVVSGETKFGLSQRYGISIAELERQNPQIINGLQVGHKLSLQNVQISQSFNQNNGKSSSVFKGYSSYFVNPGETLYGISKANGLTVDELVAANSDVLQGVLKSGQTIKIPKKVESSISVKSNNTLNTDEYIVQAGETKFGLSRKFGITIEQLESSNPQIVPMLQAGHRLTIPSGSNYVNKKPIDEKPQEEKPMASVQNTNPNTNTKENPTTNSNTKDLVSYQIQPQETLYGLSKKAGMSIDDFLKINPILSEAVQAGMIIKMPTSTVVPFEQTVVTSTSTVNKVNSKYIDLAASVSTTEKNEVVLFVPFELNKYADKNSYNDVSDDFLKQSLEFYQGAKIAIDSAKTLGITIDVKIIETSASKNNTNLLAKAKEANVKNADAVVAPFYDNENEELANYLAKENIPVVSNYTFSNKKSNTNIFEAIPSVNTQRKVMLDFLNSKNGNIIVINDVKRAESKSFIIEQAPMAKFLEIGERGAFNNDNLVEMLDANKMNFVVLDSDKNSIFISATNVLLGELSNFRIQLVVLEPTLIPDIEDVSRKRFRILKMLYPSIAPITKSAQSNKFIVNYKRTNTIEPTQNILYGFDVMFDTLLRTAQDRSFEATAKDDVTAYVELKFEYKKNNLNGYSNCGVYILQYDTDSTIKIVN